MKSTFIVIAASALIAVPLYAQEVDVHRLIAFRARESRRQCVRGYVRPRVRAGVRRHRCRSAESYGSDHSGRRAAAWARGGSIPIS